MNKNMPKVIHESFDYKFNPVFTSVVSCGVTDNDVGDESIFADIPWAKGFWQWNCLLTMHRLAKFSYLLLRFLFTKMKKSRVCTLYSRGIAFLFASHVDRNSRNTTANFGEVLFKYRVNFFLKIKLISWTWNSWWSGAMLSLSNISEATL